MTLKYDHIVGRKFIYGKQDCYALLRDFYSENFGIILPNYARPNNFWKFNLNMYMDRYLKNGFDVLHCHPSEYRPGDVFLMAIESEVANHVGVLVENGQILHHLWNRPAVVEPYRTLLRNTTVGVVRHKDVKLEQVATTGDLLDYVNPSVRRKLNEHIERNQLPYEPV